MIFIGLIPALACLALIPAYIASRKGHSFPLWYVGGFIVWPLALVESLTLREAGAPPPDRPALVQTWRPFIALCSIFVMVVAGAMIYMLAGR